MLRKGPSGPFLLLEFLHLARACGHDGFPLSKAPGTHLSVDLASLIRAIPDYPKPGIIFRDITTLLGHAEGLTATIDAMAASYRGAAIDLVAGVEARGFILGGAVAHALGLGFVPIRKKGKLPHVVLSQEYALEYGVDSIEVHADAIKPDQRVLLIDDLIATGGTAEAAISLIHRSGGDCHAAAFVVDLEELGGSALLRRHGVEVHSLLTF